ncbi:MAG: cation transporter [Treponema sp.]|jgi:copper chaperone CopZ|nr:cation transporter [Treponema sp.]
MKTTIAIGGMSCDHCAAHVRKALEDLDGVSSAKVSLKGKNAVVKHEDSVKLEALKAAVTGAGYEAL